MSKPLSNQEPQQAPMTNPHVRNRYKHTDIGMVPEVWRIDQIKNICSISTGSKNTQDKIDTGSYPFFVRSDFIERINSYSFDGEAVLTAGDGVGTGKIFHYITGKFDYHQRVYKMSHFIPNIDGFYFYKYFSKNFYNRIMSMTAKSSVDSVRMEMIANMWVPIPPILEQKAISQALSDIDSLINAIEALITKKRNIKQGVMQQLLTGKKRLPGFSMTWDTKLLAEISNIKTGKKNNEDKVLEGKYPFFVRSQNTERIDSYSFDGEAILMPGEGNIGSIFHYVNGKFDYHQRVYKISDFSKNIHGKYIYYCMTHNFGDHAMRNSVKATVDSLRLPTFKEFKINMPSFDEQKLIAQTLSDMDSEVEHLEQRLEKTKALKQGMMQTLLTGKTRLV